MKNRTGTGLLQENGKVTTVYVIVVQQVAAPQYIVLSVTIPCGTPGLMVAYFDLIRPIFTRYLRWHQTNVRHLITMFGTPSDAHLIMRLSWSTLSNALLKSTSSMQTIVLVELRA